MAKLEEGVSKKEAGCPNPQDKGTRSYPMKHVPVGTQSGGRNHPHEGKHKSHKGK
jgi:hypothetical protein